MTEYQAIIEAQAWLIYDLRREMVDAFNKAVTDRDTEAQSNALSFVDQIDTNLRASLDALDPTSDIADRIDYLHFLAHPGQVPDTLDHLPTVDSKPELPKIRLPHRTVDVLRGLRDQLADAVDREDAHPDATRLGREWLEVMDELLYERLDP